MAVEPLSVWLAERLLRRSGPTPSKSLQTPTNSTKNPLITTEAPVIVTIQAPTQSWQRKADPAPQSTHSADKLIRGFIAEEIFVIVRVPEAAGDGKSDHGTTHCFLTTQGRQGASWLALLPVPVKTAASVTQFPLADNIMTDGLYHRPGALVLCFGCARTAQQSEWGVGGMFSTPTLAPFLHAEGTNFGASNLDPETIHTINGNQRN